MNLSNQALMKNFVRSFVDIAERTTKTKTLYDDDYAPYECKAVTILISDEAIEKLRQILTEEPKR